MKRTIYLVSFVVLLVIEICIGLFIHDHFIRPYIGDVLVTVLLCCLARCVFPKKPKLLALYIFLISVVMELFQLLNLADRIGLESGILRIMLGSTFDWTDVLCYAVGCVMFYTTEQLIIKRCCRTDN